jgi:hypothetical protein
LFNLSVDKNNTSSQQIVDLRYFVAWAGVCSRQLLARRLKAPIVGVLKSDAHEGMQNQHSLIDRQA